MRPKLIHALIPLAVACAAPGVFAATTQAKVQEQIAIKGFSTGQPASAELKAAAKAPFTWTYYGAPRMIEYQTMADGTVTELGFALADSWEGYKLMGDIEKRFRESGTPNFRFHCTSENNTVNFTDKRFAVKDESCFAHDETQTLLISRRSPRNREPLLTQFPALKLMVDKGSVTLYNKKLREAKKKEDLRALMKDAGKDRDKAAADM